MAIQDGVFVGQLNVRHALEVMAQITARQYARETGQPPVTVRLTGLRRKDGKAEEGNVGSPGGARRGVRKERSLK